jgi:Zn-finger nucleic acid-binding protein
LPDLPGSVVPAKQLNHFLVTESRYQKRIWRLLDAWRPAPGQHCPDCRTELCEVRFDAAIDLTASGCRSCKGMWLARATDLEHLRFIDEHKHTPSRPTGSSSRRGNGRCRPSCSCP